MSASPTTQATARLVDQGGGCFALQGALNFVTVPELLLASELLSDSQPRFSGHSEIVVDLAAVDTCNSAGMALLLEWRARAHADKVALTLLNLPDSLRQIAQVCDVEQLLDSG